MMPTFNPRGDIALVEHISVAMDRIRAGDVVVARSVQNPRHIVCKRVLGLEGDIVTVAGTGAFGASRIIQVRKMRVLGKCMHCFYRRISGRSLSRVQWEAILMMLVRVFFLRQVPRGHVWLQGDNLHNSTDSRHYGPVPYALLRGRVFAKVWPPWDAGLVRNGPPPHPPPILR
jgi:signal peptidase I